MSRNNYAGLVRWGIIGCGNVTEVKSGPAYQKTEGFELAAVMRRDIEKLKDYAKRHDVKKYYANAEDLINDDDIDAVYIATPPDTHMYYALKVAEVGKPCCIEKPLAPSYKESMIINEAFRIKKTPLFVAYYRRSLPRFNKISLWLKKDMIGEVRHINWHFCKPPNDIDLSGAYNWRTDPKIAPGGYFDDLASHGLDLFTFLLGNIKDASGISHNQQGLYAAKDTITACWIHESGVTGTGNWNFGSDRREDRVEILGSKGKIEFSVFKESPLQLKHDEEEETIFIKNPENIQIYHVENMKKQLLHKNYKHPSIGNTALHTSWVMDKILGN